MFRTVALSALLLAGLASAATTLVRPGNPAITPLGRTWLGDSTTLQWAWSGSGVRLSFRGTAVSARLQARGAVYRVLVDGKEFKPLDLSNSNDTVFALASDLALDSHEVVLRVRTEMSQSTATFHGFEIDGTVLAPAPAPKRRIEFYGNSITCGYGILDSLNSNPFKAITEDEGMTYAAHASDSLGAERHTVCWSGRGVYRNINKDTVNPTVPRLYDRILPQDTRHLWDFSQWMPDVVVIDLGTNDYTPDNPDATRFEAAFSAFVDSLHAKYPVAKIVLLDGPMFSDGYPVGANALTHVRQRLDNVVAVAKARGIAASHVSLSAQGDLGYGADWHPSRAQAKFNGKELTDALRSLMEWSGSTSIASRTTATGATLVRQADGWNVLLPAGLASAKARLLDANGRTTHRLRLSGGTANGSSRVSGARWLVIELPEGVQTLAIPPHFR